MTNGAAGGQAQLEVFRDFCAKNSVETLDCVFPDMWGVLRGKRVPVRWLLDNPPGGFVLGALAYSWDPGTNRVDSPMAPGGNYRDMKVVPDLSTVRLTPWTPGNALCFSTTNFVDDNSPVTVDCRRILQGAADAAREEHDVEPVVACELEFYLCKPDWTPVAPDVHCYSIAKVAELAPVIGGISRSLELAGVDVEGVIIESGPGQIELNVGYGEPLALADTTAFFKHAVRAIARSHGLRATFMPNPFQGAISSALHVHQSLNSPEGHNLFAVEDDTSGELHSALMRRWLSGVLEHYVDFTAILYPTVNSYRDITGAPPRLSWGLQARDAAVRALVGIGRGTRIECKIAAADANPHLAIAAFLAAGTRGLASSSAELPQSSDAGGDPSSYPLLPDTLGAAADRLDESSLARKAFGDTFVDTYTALSRHEAQLAAAQVTEWEVKRYAELD